MRESEPLVDGVLSVCGLECDDTINFREFFGAADLFELGFHFFEQPFASLLLNELGAESDFKFRAILVFNVDGLESKRSHERNAEILNFSFYCSKKICWSKNKENSIWSFFFFEKENRNWFQVVIHV